MQGICQKGLCICKTDWFGPGCSVNGSALMEDKTNNSTNNPPSTQNENAPSSFWPVVVIVLLLVLLLLVLGGYLLRRFWINRGNSSHVFEMSQLPGLDYDDGQADLDLDDNADPSTQEKLALNQ